MVNYPVKQPSMEDGTVCMLGARTHSSCTLHLPPAPPPATRSALSSVLPPAPPSASNGRPPNLPLQPLPRQAPNQSDWVGTPWPVIRSGFGADMGGRLSMEDAHVAVDDLSQAIGDVAVAHPRAFYGIFDGHGGDSAAQFARQRLLGHVLSDPSFPLHVGAALRNAFLRTDDELAHARTPEGATLESGTTALAAMLLGRSLFVANAGDCRAVLCRQGRAVDLSSDHRVGCVRERARVERAGGYVVNGYLNEELGVTRALGDWHLQGLKCRRVGGSGSGSSGSSSSSTGVVAEKRGSLPGAFLIASSDLSAPLIAAPLIAGPLIAGPLIAGPLIAGPLIADPEVVEFHLSASDEFLILACDGLWDAFASEGCKGVVACETSQEGSQGVVAFARRRLKVHNDPERCSKDLVSEAILRHASDNVSVLTVCFSSDPPPTLKHQVLAHSQLHKSFSEHSLRCVN